VLTLSRGRAELTSARLLHVTLNQSDAATHGYRAVFDVVPPDDGTTPIELRLFLRAGGQPLTETWLYHWSPPPAADRKLY
jgi:glucans biosynthesis protein